MATKSKTRKQSTAAPDAIARLRKVFGGRLTPNAQAIIRREYAANPSGAFERCIAAVKRAGTARDAGAVCAASERKRGLMKAKRNNPEEAAAETYRKFHGRDPEAVTIVETPVKSHGVLSGVGKLERLVILAIDGKSEVTLSAFRGALLAQNEAGTQLFIEGGSQRVDLKDFGITRPHENEILGAVSEVWYETRKDHLVNGGDAIYHHKFGQKKKRLPLAIYDVRNRLLAIAGGEYDMPEVGIRG